MELCFFLVPSYESGVNLHVHPLLVDQPPPDYVLSNCKPLNYNGNYVAN